MRSILVLNHLWFFEGLIQTCYFCKCDRQKQLAKNWHFNCHCNRCQDSRDFGTMSGAVRWQKSKDGKRISNPDSDWVCRACYASQSAEEVETNLSYWWNIIDQTHTYKILLELLWLNGTKTNLSTARASLLGLSLAI